MGSILNEYIDSDDIELIGKIVGKIVKQLGYRKFKKIGILSFSI